MNHTVEEITNLLDETMKDEPGYTAKGYKDEIELAVNNLNSDEDVLAVICSNAIGRYGSTSNGAGIVIFTTKRIMVCGSPGIIKRLSTSSILINNVSSINPIKGFLLGSIQIETIGNDDIKIQNLSKPSVDKLTKILTDALNIARERIENNSAATVIQQVSAADEILKFKGLLDAGIITQEEFDSKKKQLLGL